MAAELSKMRSPCDGCAASVELTTHLDGQLIVADVHHEIRCRQGRDSLRENLISADEVAQALDDTTAARA
ncbi:hypothetical protein AU189_11480 [Mycolicibacterium acapulense]|nr:hypothetical protein AU189_11480 [Mycolicibacterium acapulense]